MRQGALVVGLLMLAACGGCQNSSRSDGDSARAGPAPANAAAPSDGWRSTFAVTRDRLGLVGSNPYFALTPGTARVYKEGDTTLTISVLGDTRLVDGVLTRVVEEREEVRGRPTEVSRNFFAIDRESGDVYYFGEEVDIYKNGVIVDHPGVWMSGVNGAHFGLAMPARPVVGDKYYQEVAPGVAMDRAEIVALDDVIQTGAGVFANCVRVRETTPLEAAAEFKWYATGIGLVQDDEAILSSRSDPAPAHP